MAIAAFDGAEIDPVIVPDALDMKPTLGTIGWWAGWGHTRQGRDELHRFAGWATGTGAIARSLDAKRTRTVDCALFIVRGSAAREDPPLHSLIAPHITTAPQSRSDGRW
jgi:hypothetical protein